MKKKTFIISALLILLVSLVWLILTPILLPSVQADSQLAAAHPGFQAPPFTLQTLDGSEISLSDFDGQPVLVFFWASWCSVCKSTMPDLQIVYEDYAPLSFEILAVNMTTQDTSSEAITYFQSQGYTFPLLLDLDGSVGRDYQVHALPTSVLVGLDGSVLDVVIGAGMSESFLRSQLDVILQTQEGN